MDKLVLSVILIIAASVVFTAIYYIQIELHIQECNDLGQKVLDMFTCRDYTEEEKIRKIW